ncbi:lysozyme inhibitor LprI family protein [Pseudoxanthomonas wuyuanensis]|uniref:Uncharacterized conserved protein YecT, DUF1311 family n=1 Tax=Pseudoxanthomonas wuyuanensis TaxID=1073196 RepID=A0A286D273_9GAMM|nr:lysozyme inhibitor LprI family protein [Pseudoxanthomonas wuyuanensis]KAF1723158.1 DUF1311 domain-containing protein [Pseudoxanthomonas wuyuanensis]SOD52752.1 Uncharacterized conserved protein YecT, DUF1311 family [Pseudoxanthomonas wuyuanensis]
MRTLLAALGLAAMAVPAWADPVGCDPPLSTMESDLCQSQAVEQAQAQLDALYQRVLRSLADEQACPVSAAACGNAQLALAQAQRHWAAFRDADCESAYAFHSDGSGRNSARLHCLAGHISARERQLHEHFEIR